MRLKLICAILVGLLVVFGAGCGGSDDNDSATPATTATTSESDDSAADDSTADDSSDGGIALNSEDCQKLAAASATVGQALSGTVPEGMDEDIARLNELAEAAPDEIKDDFQVLAEAAAKFAELGIDANSTPAEAMAAIGRLSNEIDVAAVSQASQNIATWAQENCSALAG